MHKPDLYLAPGDPQLTRDQLISAHELNENLHDAAWCAVDCQSEPMDPSAGRRAYVAGHIPGAMTDRTIAVPADTDQIRCGYGVNLIRRTLLSRRDNGGKFNSNDWSRIVSERIYYAL